MTGGSRGGVGEFQFGKVYCTPDTEKYVGRGQGVEWVSLGRLGHPRHRKNMFGGEEAGRGSG